MRLRYEWAQDLYPAQPNSGLARKGAQCLAEGRAWGALGLAPSEARPNGAWRICNGRMSEIMNGKHGQPALQWFMRARQERLLFRH
jgi:hypothetical protein